MAIKGGGHNTPIMVVEVKGKPPHLITKNEVMNVSEISEPTDNRGALDVSGVEAGKNFEKKKKKIHVVIK